ncbi:MAG: WD40 repeat domain-containing protein, partial [Planctomycetaceae bacterium]|nr:WD40 repeat domain-containing protein [Planctomycetaceae bacterium]
MARILLLSLLLVLSKPLSAQTEVTDRNTSSPAAGDVPGEEQPGEEQPGEEEPGEQELRRVLPVFDPGCHTRPICAVGFSADATKLITVSRDLTIQIWSVATGERLDVLWLPGCGQMSGSNLWDVAAISTDGKRVAIGGGLRSVRTETGESEHSQLIVVDIAQRSVRVVS